MASGVCVLLIMRKGFLEINTNSPRVSCRIFHLFSFTGISGPENLFLFFFLNSFIYLCLAVLGLHCCRQSFQLWGVGAALQLRCLGFSCFRPMASVAPRRGESFLTKGIKTMFPTLVGGFLTSGTPQKSLFFLLFLEIVQIFYLLEVFISVRCEVCIQLTFFSPAGQ